MVSHSIFFLFKYSLKAGSLKNLLLSKYSLFKYCTLLLIKLSNSLLFSPKHKEIILLLRLFFKNKLGKYFSKKFSKNTGKHKFGNFFNINELGEWWIAWLNITRSPGLVLRFFKLNKYKKGILLNE